MTPEEYQRKRREIRASELGVDEPSDVEPMTTDTEGGHEEYKTYLADRSQRSSILDQLADTTTIDPITGQPFPSSAPVEFVPPAPDEPAVVLSPRSKRKREASPAPARDSPETETEDESDTEPVSAKLKRAKTQLDALSSPEPSPEPDTDDEPILQREPSWIIAHKKKTDDERAMIASKRRALVASLSPDPDLPMLPPRRKRRHISPMDSSSREPSLSIVDRNPRFPSSSMEMEVPPRLKNPVASALSPTLEYLTAEDVSDVVGEAQPVRRSLTRSPPPFAFADTFPQARMSNTRNKSKPQKKLATSAGT